MKLSRLSGRKLVDRLRRRGTAWRGKTMKITYMIGVPRGKKDGFYVGTQASTKLHKSAVKRNRMRRRCREALRLYCKDHASSLPVLSGAERSRRAQHDTAELKVEAKKLLERWAEIEHMLYFSGPHDAANCYLTVSGGAGGTEAQDWAEMLLRMYLRYAERKGWKTSIFEKTHGQEAGIKSATLYIEGDLSYGHLKAERGTHRLVRLSPFNAKNLRQTSFALVEVLPEIEGNEEIDINPTDLRIDTFRASGAGGQHVNTTDS
ncbi:MAG: ribonuclease P protein component, partial [Chloroflexi bacterium]|nr:ribonuclease P protein component [Chloroflexota bacterium]